MTPAAWAASTGAAIAWYVLLAVIGAAVTGMVLSEAAAWRGHEETALALACPRCDADPARRCNCLADCGRRYCDWATVIDDGEFGRQLHELLESEGGNQ